MKHFWTNPSNAKISWQIFYFPIFPLDLLGKQQENRVTIIVTLLFLFKNAHGWGGEANLEPIL